MGRKWGGGEGDGGGKGGSLLRLPVQVSLCLFSLTSQLSEVQAEAWSSFCSSVSVRCC